MKNVESAFNNEGVFDVFLFLLFLSAVRRKGDTAEVDALISLLRKCYKMSEYACKSYGKAISKNRAAVAECSRGYP